MGLGVYAAVDQPDVAALDHDGVTYRCYLWRNVERATVEASLFVEQDDGQTVFVDSWIVGTGTDVVIGVTTMDCPRLIARGQRFIAHWIGQDPNEVYRGLLDVTDIPAGWTSFHAMTIGSERLYDVDVIEGSATDFIVAAYSGASTIEMRRVTAPYALGSNVWTQSPLVNTVNPRVFTVAASITANRVMTVWETIVLGGDRQLVVTPWQASDGSLVGAAVGIEVFPALEDYDHAAVGICRMDQNEWCVIAEVRDPGTNDDNTQDRRYVAWASIGDDAVPTSGHSIVPNLHLVSRPWAWASSHVVIVPPGIPAPSTNVYALVSYKNMYIGGLWEQAFGFVLNLDRRNFGATEGFVCSAVMNGSVDGRPSGESDGHVTGDLLTPAYLGPLSAGQRQSLKRINHLSHVSGPPLYELGPDRKSVVIAYLGWQQILPGDLISLPNPTPFTHPTMAAVRGFRFYHEDPWMLARDDREPTLPTTRQYKGAHHRPIAYPAETAGALVFGGGVTQVFDGVQLCELGFFWAPEIISFTPSDAGGPLSYWYVVTYSWTDSKGQLHRSPPSTPRILNRDAIGPGGGGGNPEPQELLVRTMTASQKDAWRNYPSASPINIEVWRTYYDDGEIAADPEPVGPNGIVGTLIFKRVFTGSRGVDAFELRDTPVNDRTVWAQAVTDGKIDALVAVADLLPWQLDTSTLLWQPPTPKPHTPLSVVANWANRLWGVNPEDSRVIEYSEEILPRGTQYVMPEFNDVNTYRFDARGEITAMVPMDNALIVFTRDAIFALSGEGNAGGAPGNLIMQTVADGTGCIEPRSIVYGPPGVFFQSAKGYYLLNRGLDIDYVTAGAAIEDTIRAAGNIRGATLIEDRHQIRLTLNDAAPGSPRIAIYDYYHKLWALAQIPRMSILGTLANPRFHDMQSAGAWRGREGETVHVTLQQGGGIGVERASYDTVYADDEQGSGGTDTIAVPLDLTVEWIHVAGIAGYKKLRSIGIQLDKINACNVTVQLWYDRNGDYAEGPPDDTFTDSAARGYVRVRPSIRKCTAVLIRIFESGVVPLTENLKITGLTLEVGLKRGPRRVPDNQVGV